MLPAPVRALIDELVARGGAGRPVVFDADGTLWRGDVGEDFLRFLSQQRRLGARSEGCYARYEELLAASPARAYAFAVEVMAGLEEQQLAAWCAEYFAARYAGRVFPFVRPLLARLSAAGFTPWVCSASPRWVVAPGAALLGISPANVIGVDCGVEHGRLTGEVLPPVPCGPGKVTWLERRGVNAALAVGNGDLDLDMLAAAERAVVVAPPDASNHLVAEGLRRGWPILRA